MTFRTRLLVFFTLTLAAAVVLASYVISVATTRAFERVDDRRTRALIAQFRREFQARGGEVIRRVEAIAGSEPLVHMAADLSRPGADPAPYLEQAAILAREQGLEFLEIFTPDSAIVSSAQYPARFGYRKEWVAQPVDWKQLGAFVETEELPEGSAIALLAVRSVGPPGANLLIAGGQRLDKEMLQSLAAPHGMRAELYGNSPEGASRGRGPEIESIVKRARQTGAEVTTTLRDALHVPLTVHAIPLQSRASGAGEVLLVSDTREELWDVTWFIRRVALAGAAGGVLAGLIFGWWATARVTRPVRELAAGAREVSSGNWDTRVGIDTKDEIGELGAAFNQMTRQLIDQRERLVQVERVAAWRELARRLAHELKNPLFPLQITVENLQRARLQAPDQFDEVFKESTSTLLAELTQLKTIISRFSDFAKMPAPRFEPLRLAEFLPPILKLFEPQWEARTGAPIKADLVLEDSGIVVAADPDQLSRALRNLILNAMDAMPGGGSLTVRAAAQSNTVFLEVADSGAGLTREECERLFTPYYTTKQHGTGLGLAIVQSVVSDHGGKISVASEPGRGSTFKIELPMKR